MIDIQKDQARRILVTALGECRRQQTDFRGVVDLLSAYEVAEYNSEENPTEDHILRLGQLIEPVKNEYGYRTTPVGFLNGGKSADARYIPTLMDGQMVTLRWINQESPELNAKDVYDWTKMFLWIHPFRDGNGRCAWILYNWLRGTLDYPLPLPEFTF